MYHVRVRSEFTASHAIPLPEGSPEPTHDHRWVVDLLFGGTQLDHRGVLVDFVHARRALDDLLARMDGTDLNTNPLCSGAVPSAEMLARMIHERLGAVTWHPGRLLQVTVHEAPGCAATFLAPPQAGPPHDRHEA